MLSDIIFQAENCCKYTWDGYIHIWLNPLQLRLTDAKKHALYYNCSPLVERIVL